MVAKKNKEDFFQKFTFFKMAAVFRPKMAKITVFGLKMAAILKKVNFWKKSSLFFVCHHGKHMWSKFQLCSTFLAKLVSKNVILRYRDLKSLRDSFFEKSARFRPIFPKILKIFQLSCFFMVYYLGVHEKMTNNTL